VVAAAAAKGIELSDVPLAAAVLAALPPGAPHCRLLRGRLLG
jgi:hypothetical protein